MAAPMMAEDAMDQDDGSSSDESRSAGRMMEDGLMDARRESQDSGSKNLKMQQSTERRIIITILV